MSGPTPSRPHMPGYDEMLDAGSGLLPWSWAAERLSQAHNYWLATTRPDGRPHAMPVWGLWLDGTFYFSTGTRSRKARNLAANARRVVCPKNAADAVILEGVAEEETDPEVLAQFKDAYFKKYDWDMNTTRGGIYAVRPRVAFAFIENAGESTGSATRWRFD